MYAIWAVNLLLATVSNLVTCQQPKASNPDIQPPPRTTTSVSNLFSGLEGLVLGVDETLNRITSPESYKNVAQIGNLPNNKLNVRRINYFDKVRENYEQLQKQIRQTIESPGEIFKVPELVNMNFQNRGQKAFLNLATPFVNLQIRGKATPGKIFTDETKSEGTPQLPKVEMPSTDMSTSLKIGGSHIFPKVNEKPDIPDDLQKRSGKLARPSHTSTKKLQVSDKIFDLEGKLPEQPLPQSSDNKGRILGDLMFSESTFDKYLRRVLESSVGKAIFDPSIVPPTHVVEKIRAVTRNPFEIPSGVNSQRPHKTGSKHTTNKHSLNQDFQRFPDGQISNQRPRIILAFTLDGIPLKLKTDPRILDPLEFLQRRLASAGVSLNIPVDSIRGVVPVGNNILQLGSGFTATQSNALFVDITNESQLQSLLRSLKSIQNHQ